MTKDIEELLPDLNAWRTRNAADISLLDYVSFICTPDSFFAYAELFAPTLVNHAGEYFIASKFSVDSYDEWFTRLKDTRAVQRVMNHIHISTLFQQQFVPDQLAAAAASTLATIWSRQFASLDLVGKAAGTDLANAEVTLYRG